MHTIYIIIILIVFVYFAFFHNSENFSGAAIDNPYSNLTCINTVNGNVIAKVSRSFNPIDPKNPNITLHGLVHPDSINTSNPRLVQLSDIVDPSVPCDDAKFTAAYVKDIRNSNSKARQLFDKIYKSTNATKYSTWQTIECTAQHLSGKLGSHWCADTYNVINNDITCNPNAPIGTVPHSFCSKQQNLQDYANSNDLRLGTSPDKTLQNFIKASGRGCTSNCLVSSGAIPQNTNGMSLKDSKGVPLYTFGGTGGLDIVQNSKAQNPTAVQDTAFKNSPYYNKYQNCIQSCAI